MRIFSNLNETDQISFVSGGLILSNNYTPLLKTNYVMIESLPISYDLGTEIWYDGIIFIAGFLIPQSKSVKNLVFSLRSNLDLQLIQNILVHIIKVLLGFVTVVCALPVILPLWCLLLMFSEISRLRLWIKYGLTANKALGLDAAWGSITPESKPFITALLTFNGHPNINKIRKLIQDNILNVLDHHGEFKHKKLRQDFSEEFGYYRWRNSDDFNVENHVKMYTLSELLIEDKNNVKIVSENTEPLDFNQGSLHLHLTNKNKTKFTESVRQKTINDNLVLNYLESLNDKCFSVNQPPWELIILKRTDNRYSAIWRLHHAIGDGVSLIRLLFDALVDTPVDFPQVGLKTPSLITRVLRSAWAICLVPFATIRMLSNKDSSPLHGPPLTGHKIMRLTNNISLSEIKLIKNRMKSTVNDVLLCCLSAAVAAHYQRRGSATSNLTVLVPVSFHDLSVENYLSNNFSPAVVKIPTPQNVAPLHRLSLIKECLNKLKHDPLLISIRGIINNLCEVVPSIIAKKMFTTRGITGGASSIPGPQKKIRVWGDELENIGFWVPDRAPAGLGISMLSYCDHVTVGLSVDTGLIKDHREVNEILHDFECEVDKLQWHISTLNHYKDGNITVV